MPKFPQNRAGPLNLLLHQPCEDDTRSRRRRDLVVWESILTKAGALSIRSDSRGNKDPYSEGVSHLLTPIKVQKGCPLSLGDHFNPKTLYDLRIALGSLKEGLKVRKTSKNRISHYLIPV